MNDKSSDSLPSSQAKSAAQPELSATAASRAVKSTAASIRKTNKAKSKAKTAKKSVQPSVASSPAKKKAETKTPPKKESKIGKSSAKKASAKSTVKLTAKKIDAGRKTAINKKSGSQKKAAASKIKSVGGALQSKAKNKTAGTGHTVRGVSKSKKTKIRGAQATTPSKSAKPIIKVNAKNNKKKRTSAPVRGAAATSIKTKIATPTAPVQTKQEITPAVAPATVTNTIESAPSIEVANPVTAVVEPVKTEPASSPVVSVPQPVKQETPESKAPESKDEAVLTGISASATPVVEPAVTPTESVVTTQQAAIETPSIVVPAPASDPFRATAPQVGGAAIRDAKDHVHAEKAAQTAIPDAAVTQTNVTAAPAPITSVKTPIAPSEPTVKTTATVNKPVQNVTRQQSPVASGPNAPKPAHPAPAKKLELPEAFAKLGLETPILHSLASIHFVTPSEIQEKLIPVALTGKDVIGQARTGTGKTAAFGLPILQRLHLDQPFQALVVVPTRELAVQVEAELVRFGKHKPIRFALAYGGTKIGGQIKIMSRQPHVVVGTPGRIIDLMERQVLPLQNMKFVVCDEVDRMFDIGFRDDIRRILAACVSEHQTIFVSATINDDIERMVARHMKNPERIFTSSPDEQLTNPEARQFYVGVEPWDKQRALRLLMKSEKPHLAIIFCRTKRSVDKVAAGLAQDGVNASPIHGDLMQNKRERIMRGFRTGKINVLVATDLASRGIDVHEVTHVVNYDIPEDPEAYVHRVGRTARMGATGMAVTFVSRGQGQLQTEIEKLTNHLMEEYKIPGFEPRAEPNPRSAGQHGTAVQPAPAAAVNPTPQGTATESGQTPAPIPVAERPAEGYMPTGFGHVKLEQSFRPISGKFKVRHRR